jgi:hypothetical protein
MRWARWKAVCRRLQFGWTSTACVCAPPRRLSCTGRQSSRVAFVRGALLQAAAVGNNSVIKDTPQPTRCITPDFRDGCQTHILVTGDGVGNTFSANVSHLGRAAD